MLAVTLLLRLRERRKGRLRRRAWLLYLAGRCLVAFSRPILNK